MPDAYATVTPMIAQRERGASAATSTPAPSDFKLTLWTDDPALAAEADAAGVDRIGLDLETAGKQQRQAGLGTWVSTHRIAHLHDVRSALGRAELFARVNPLSSRSEQEVERVLDLGVEVLMLPMFHSASEVETFVEIVNGRASVVPLLETCEAVAGVASLAALAGIDEVHVGINDLALALGLRNRFEVLDCPQIKEIATCVLGARKRLGIGGIARVDDRSLPIPADLLYAQYTRLGATATLLSRAFVAAGGGAGELTREVVRARERLAQWFAADEHDVLRAQRDFRRALAGATRW
jgi:2-keto-3-deoxy-L-rhamnonate aldolase RhmA